LIYSSLIIILVASTVVINNNQNYNFVAREEKSVTNTNGLGQVSHFCCYWFGMFLMSWLSSYSDVLLYQ